VISINKSVERIPIANDSGSLVEDLDRALDAAPERDTVLSRASVPRELLGKPRLVRLFAYAAIDWAWIALGWVAMARAPYWAYPALVLLIAGRFHAFGVILHDMTHMPLRKKTALVRLVEVLTGYPLATTFNAMRYHHLRHHRDSGMPTDPYFKPSVRGRPAIFLLIWLRHLLLVPAWTIRGPYGLLAVVFPKMRTSYARIFLQDRSGKDLTHDPEVLACAREELGQVIAHAALFTFTAFHPQTALYFYFIPVTVTGLFAGYRVLREHDYVPTMDRTIGTILATTVDHNLGPLGRLFFAPRNIGYHVVHHLHPQVALENLPRLRDWYIANYGSRYPAPYGQMRLEPVTEFA
jgi:fatty acid desaturase